MVVTTRRSRGKPEGFASECGATEVAVVVGASVSVIVPPVYAGASVQGVGIEHHYATSIEWLGNRGTGTSGYRDYGREVLLTAEGKHPIDGSADKSFHGNADRWNPEDMLLAALSQCHLLSYLHVAVLHGIVVTAYTDDAVGTMEQTSDGGGRFTSVTLRPNVTVATEQMVEAAKAAHREASAKCFIATSVNFPVHHHPTIVVG